MSTDSFGTPENFSGIFSANFLTKNSEEIRRAGGSETTKWSQPGSREAALRGLRGFPQVPGFPARI